MKNLSFLIILVAFLCFDFIEPNSTDDKINWEIEILEADYPKDICFTYNIDKTFNANHSFEDYYNILKFSFVFLSTKNYYFTKSIRINIYDEL